ncbi:MAG TPA: hypothetical protein H9713_02930 [Candidatus Mediterraneibacter surreyensis]|nr:hypothetical protein [Candidatus Mediterraneibacter surreyensis]
MLKIKFNVSLRIVTEIMFSITLIAILNPYFLWTGYKNGIFSANGIPILKILYIISIGLSLLYIIQHKTINQTYLKLFLELLVCLFVLQFICGLRILKLEEIVIASILNFILIGCFVLFPQEIKINIYRLFLLFFVVSIIPGIIYSVITFLGINIPYTTITAASEIKQNSFVTYIQYPFAVQISKSYDILGNLNRFRLCGIYDEPGRVGTVCALFLVAEELKINKNWKNRLLFIGGCLSLSLAFFIIIFIYFCYYLVKERRYKYFIWMIILFSAFIIFLNIPFRNVALVAFQNRFTITATGLSGDNRTNEAFESLFATFLNKSNMFNLLFGLGDGSMYQILTEKNIEAGSSYKTIIYDFGIIGTILYITWIVRYAFYHIKANKKIVGYTLINILIFIINLYQRPTTFYPPYLLILLGGIVYQLTQVRPKKKEIVK